MGCLDIYQCLQKYNKVYMYVFNNYYMILDFKIMK